MFTKNAHHTKPAYKMVAMEGISTLCTIHVGVNSVDKED